MSGNGGNVKVRLYGALRHAVGSREVDLPVAQVTLKEALQRLAQQHARTTDLLFDQQGDVWASVILLLNDEPAPEGAATAVKGGDVVSILLPLAGG